MVCKRLSFTLCLTSGEDRFRGPHALVILAWLTCLFCFFCERCPAQQSRDIVILRLSVTDDDASTGLLERELVRQSFLIAARDESGLATRDESLNEVEPANVKSTLPQFVISVKNENGQELVVRVSEHGKKSSLLTALSVKREEASTITKLVAQAEGFSRSEFKSLLKMQDLKLSQPKSPSSASIPEAVIELLGRWKGLPQYAAIRTLHSKIRSEGESAELLSGLAHAYSNLGLVTEKQWWPGHKVFKARALLYAERLQVKYPGAAALRTRAYVRALTGLHESALEDLAQAAKLKGTVRLADADAEEVQAIQAFASGDMKKLTELAADFKTESKRKLAACLMMAIAETIPINELQILAANAVAETDSDNQRFVDGVYKVVDGVDQNKLLLEALLTVWRTIFDDIRAIPERPKSVDKLLQDGVRNGDLSTAFGKALKAGGRAEVDRNEPSLIVAANLMREVEFVHIWWQLDSAKERRLDSSTLINDAKKKLRDHPYFQFLMTYSANEKEAAIGRKDVANAILKDQQLTYIERPILDVLDKDLREKVTKRILNRCDLVFDDLIAFYALGGYLQKGQLIEQLREVSGHQPRTIALISEFDREYAYAKLDEWEKEFASDAYIQGVLAQRYVDLARYEDAIRCLTRKKQLFGTSMDCIQLAYFYQALGDEENRIRMLKESLDYPHHAYDSASTNMKLASHFMKRGDSATALKHADEAAKSGLRRYLLFASETHEQAGDWQGAESFAKQIAETSGLPEEWYFWCRRTGRGNLAEARTLARPAIDEYEKSIDVTKRTRAAFFHFAEDGNQRAVQILNDAFILDHNPFLKLHAALILDEMGDAAGRDALLIEAGQAASERAHGLANVIHDFRNALRADRPIPLDLAVNKWRYQLGAVGSRQSFLGQFLILHGRMDEGVALLKDSATCPQFMEDDSRIDFEACMIAGVRLARRGIKTESMRLSQVSAERDEILKALEQANAWYNEPTIRRTEQIFQTVIDKHPKEIDAYYKRSEMHRARKNIPGQIADLTKCIEILPKAIELRLMRASANEQLGEYVATVRECEDALKLDPNFASTYYVYGLLLSVCPDKSIRNGKKALEMTKRSLESESAFAPWLRQLALGAAYAECGQFPEAVRQTETAFKLAPDHSKPFARHLISLFSNKRPYHRGD